MIEFSCKVFGSNFSAGKTLLCGDHEGAVAAMTAFKKRVSELDLNRYSEHTHHLHTFILKPKRATAT